MTLRRVPCGWVPTVRWRGCPGRGADDRVLHAFACPVEANSRRSAPQWVAGNIDAPVTGLPTSAADGTLTCSSVRKGIDLGGGPGLLDTLASRLFHFGGLLGRERHTSSS